ncbi:hypothetical protein DLR60_08755 [Vibrio tarriae]|uniref:Uncharacterized protein n=1 Tax=Vibrio tarriae TaxID=2014742 RepID=A0AAU8WKD3_9VIBR|nr:hypothetical protein CEQ48_19065 [Vibrio tarriae]RBM26812.1 hypothetical protein DLR59_10750 [Vibrio tarriae]RBM29119.1 hypothetical protein DLR61_10395 [Vibrio tarriae]RBM33655.1 hypothetical protein DLR63_18335 [Vibrio tarriae]RBM40115.1 hypothetical protein DLR62_08845 [Vibrio tarriae]
MAIFLSQRSQFDGDGLGDDYNNHRTCYSAFK